MRKTEYSNGLSFAEENGLYYIDDINVSYEEYSKRFDCAELVRLEKYRISQALKKEGRLTPPTDKEVTRVR